MSLRSVPADSLSSAPPVSPAVSVVRTPMHHDDSVATDAVMLAAGDPALLSARWHTLPEDVKLSSSALPLLPPPVDGEAAPAPPILASLVSSGAAPPAPLSDAAVELGVNAAFVKTVTVPTAANNADDAAFAYGWVDPPRGCQLVCCPLVWLLGRSQSAKPAFIAAQKAKETKRLAMHARLGEIAANVEAKKRAFRASKSRARAAHKAKIAAGVAAIAQAEQYAEAVRVAKSLGQPPPPHPTLGPVVAVSDAEVLEEEGLEELGDEAAEVSEEAAVQGLFLKDAVAGGAEGPPNMSEKMAELCSGGDSLIVMWGFILLFCGYCCLRSALEKRHARKAEAALQLRMRMAGLIRDEDDDDSAVGEKRVKADGSVYTEEELALRRAAARKAARMAAADAEAAAEYGGCVRGCMERTVCVATCGLSARCRGGLTSEEKREVLAIVANRRAGLVRPKTPKPMLLGSNGDFEHSVKEALDQHGVCGVCPCVHRTAWALMAGGAVVCWCCMYILLWGLYAHQREAVAFIIIWSIAQCIAFFGFIPLIELLMLWWGMVFAPSWAPYVAWIPGVGPAMCGALMAAMGDDHGVLSGRMEHLSITRAAGTASAMSPENAAIVYGTTILLGAITSGVQGMVKRLRGGKAAKPVDGEGLGAATAAATGHLTERERGRLIFRLYAREVAQAAERKLEVDTLVARLRVREVAKLKLKAAVRMGFLGKLRRAAAAAREEGTGTLDST